MLNALEMESIYISLRLTDKEFLLTLFIGGVAGVGILRLKIYLMNIPWACSSLTKYVQRRFAGKAEVDFENGVLFGSSIVR